MGNWESVGEALVEVTKEDSEAPPLVGLLLALPMAAMAWVAVCRFVMWWCA